MSFTETLDSVGYRIPVDLIGKRILVEYPEVVLPTPHDPEGPDVVTSVTRFEYFKRKRDGVLARYKVAVWALSMGTFVWWMDETGRSRTSLWGRVPSNYELSRILGAPRGRQYTTEGKRLGKAFSKKMRELHATPEGGFVTTRSLLKRLEPCMGLVPIRHPGLEELGVLTLLAVDGIRTTVGALTHTWSMARLTHYGATTLGAMSGESWTTCTITALCYPTLQGMRILGTEDERSHPSIMEPLINSGHSALRQYAQCYNSHEDEIVGDESYALRSATGMRADGLRLGPDYLALHTWCEACGTYNHQSDDYCGSCGHSSDRHPRGPVEDSSLLTRRTCVSDSSYRVSGRFATEVYPYGMDVVSGAGWMGDSKTRYFGIELEAERRSGSVFLTRKTAVHHAFDTVPELFQIGAFKHDGSLDDGAEFVSIPLPLSYWQGDNPLKKLNADADWRRGMISHHTSTCGLHVHVSRNTVPEPVIAKLVYMFNDPAMHDVLTRVARRDLWGRYTHANKKGWLSDTNGYVGPDAWRHTRNHRYIGKTQYNQGDRYTPLNLPGNRNSIEFRIFRGSLVWATIQASIEFCDACITFCSTHGAGALTPEKFVQWMEKHVTRKLYPALRDYLLVRGVLAHRPNHKSTIEFDRSSVVS